MYLRDIQLTMRNHDFALYMRARDTVWEPIELRLHRRIPKRFQFADVKKIVIQVGPEAGSQQYQVALGVGIWHYPEFNVPEFLSLPGAEQVRRTVQVIRQSFHGLSNLFQTEIPWLFEELDAIEQEPNNAFKADVAKATRP